MSPAAAPRPKIGTIAPWFGGKRTLATEIITLLGPHRVYWELFCGGMAVFLAKKPCQMETLCDMHGDLINLAYVLADEDLAFKLYKRVERALYHEQIFLDCRQRWLSTPENEANRSPDVDRAYDYFVVSWCGLNGVSGTKRGNYGFALRWCASGGQGAGRWQSVKDSMPAWHRRLAQAVIIRRDAFEVLDKIKDEAGTAIYLDPPYFDKSSKYLYEFGPADHERLARLAGKFRKARVVVSYYDHPKLQELYPGWARVEFAAKQSLKNVNRNKNRHHAGCGRGKKTEVLLVNAPGAGGLFE